MYVEFYDRLKSLPQSLLEGFVFQLMLDGKIDYHKLTEMHIERMETLRQGQSEHYCKLRMMVMEMHNGAKKDLKKNLGAILHYLQDCGEINVPHDVIDKKYGGQEAIKILEHEND